MCLTSTRPGVQVPSPLLFCSRSGVVQRLERWDHTPKVGGSSPFSVIAALVKLVDTSDLKSVSISREYRFKSDKSYLGGYNLVG